MESCRKSRRTAEGARIFHSDLQENMVWRYFSAFTVHSTYCRLQISSTVRRVTLSDACARSTSTTSTFYDVFTTSQPSPLLTKLFPVPVTRCLTLPTCEWYTATSGGCSSFNDQTLAVITCLRLLQFSGVVRYRQTGWSSPIYACREQFDTRSCTGRLLLCHCFKHFGRKRVWRFMIPLLDTVIDKVTMTSLLSTICVQCCRRHVVGINCAMQRCKISNSSSAVLAYCYAWKYKTNPEAFAVD